VASIAERHDDVNLAALVPTTRGDTWVVTRPEVIPAFNDVRRKVTKQCRTVGATARSYSMCARAGVE
jgi:hypothetical protein